LHHRRSTASSSATVISTGQAPALPPLVGFGAVIGLMEDRACDGDLLHGLDLRAHDVGAPLSQHGGNDVELPAVEDIAQLFAIEPGARAVRLVVMS
jgi:hypothetical protein